MNGLLRHCASIWKGLSGAVPYPTTDLDLAWLGGYDGNDLLNTNGANPTYVSGSGLDAIYDFSVLSDIRFDKSNATYWGAVIDAYFYYDPGNPYHAKLKDFHYKFLNAQVTFDDTFFLKATATTDTSNEIASVQSFLTYSTVQTGVDLTKLRTYIGIQDDFLGAEEVLNYNFDSGANWTLDTGWTISGGFAVAAGTSTQIEQITTFDLNELYLTEIKLVDITQGVVRVELGTATGTNRGADGVYQEEITSAGLKRVSLDAGATLIGKVDYCSVKKSYKDYYAA